MNLTHDEAQELIHLQLDGSLTPDRSEQLEAHLAICPGCREFSRRLNACDVEIQSRLAAGRPGVQSTPAVLERRGAALTRRLQRRNLVQRISNSIRPVALAVVAVALVVVFAWIISSTRPQPAAAPTDTPTIFPTPSPVENPLPIPSAVSNDWAGYNNPSFAVRLRYPQTWAITSDAYASGPDGFFRLISADAPGGLEAACREVLSMGGGDFFGTQPKVDYLTLAGQPACRIYPSDDQGDANGKPGAYVATYPEAIAVGRILELLVERDYLDPIANTLEFVIPGITPTETPRPGMVDFSSPDLPLTLRYPSEWTEQVSPNKIAGATGFFELKAESWPSADLTRLCEARANSGSFGPTPEINLTAVGNLSACMILTSLNRAENNGSMLIVQGPAVENGLPPYYSLYADPAHFQEIMGSLRVNLPVSATPTYVSPAFSTPNPSEVPTQIEPETSTVAGMTIEAYPVVRAGVDTPSHFEFRDRIPGSVFDRRRAWREPDLDARWQDANQALSPFGYELRGSPIESQPMFNLYHGESLVQENITNFWPVRVNASGDNFLLETEANNAGTWLVQKGTLEQRDSSQHFFIPPTYAGDDLIDVSSGSSLQHVTVTKNGQAIYDFSVLFMVDIPVKSITGFDGHWFLEVDGFLIEDGYVINDRLGYDEIFGFSLIDGKPFYYFVKDGKTGISYDGQVLPGEYDQVEHYLCCEPAAFNNGANASMAWFYALKDDTWYYVEIGKYD